MSGETIRRRNLILGMQRGRGSVSEPIPLNDRACYRPGILMFSRRQQLLHLNRRALELTGHFDQAEIGSACEIHSASVLDLRLLHAEDVGAVVLEPGDDAVETPEEVAALACWAPARRARPPKTLTCWSQDRARPANCGRSRPA